MTNKELQKHLQQFPDEMQVVFTTDDCRYIAPGKPMMKFFGTCQQHMIAIRSEI